MWVNKILFQTVLDDNKRLSEDCNRLAAMNHRMAGSVSDARAQKAKDDISIDWMRHRINALEKERTTLVQKIAGVSLPTPEIVPTRPGTISELPTDFNSLVEHFEDVGDNDAQKLGIAHDEQGFLENRKS